MAIYLGDKKVGVSQVTTVTNSKFIPLVTRGISTVTASDLEGATSIGNSAFLACTSLTSITIPDSVTSIGGSAFYGCSGLTDVTIGNGVTSIGEWAFYACSKLKSIIIKAAVAPTLSNVNAFQDTNNCPIYVPAASVDAYKTANTWSSLADRIEAISEL